MNEKTNTDMKNNSQFITHNSQFKNTDIGRIPVHWETVLLVNVCNRIGVGLATSVTKYYRKDGVPIIRNMNIKDGYFDDYDMLYVDESFSKNNSTKLAKSGDVLTVHTGSNIGLTCVLPDKYDNSQTFTTLITTPKKQILSSKFLAIHMSSSFGKSEINRLQVGGGKGNLNTGELKQYYFALPPLPEQEAIAQVLSDTDGLIGALEKRIAKKRLIKQGAMQTLLTPPMNPELAEGWEVKKLPGVCWFQEGPGVRKSQFTTKGVKLLNGTNIEKGKLLLDKTDRYVSEKEAFGWYSHFLVDSGDILIACSGVTIDKFHEKVTLANTNHLPLCMNTSTMRFKIKSSFLIKSYLIHFLKSKNFKQQISGKATGSAQLNFGPSHVSKVTITLPPIKEQTRIATILSDMDKEIDALETKLAKTKQLKQGLMQQLLTGKIRLV